MKPIELHIAKPCSQSWTAMKGDEQVRHCLACKKNVYNLGQMTEQEIADLIQRTEGRFCGRLYKRSDGRMLTHDCPKGVAAVRRRMAASLTSACVVLVYGVSFFRTPKTITQAKEVVKANPSVKKVIKKIDPPLTMALGSIDYPEISRADVIRLDKTSKR